jgi:hypothetical protein
MAGIEDIIARSRQAGGFAERRRFSLARGAALRKLRDFALADPHFYVLELIQAAVAGGAHVIHVDFGPRHSLVAWKGWSLDRTELAHLMDHLFASHDALELARLRHLALGLNALRFFAPGRILLETGDGTQAHRLAIRERSAEEIELEVGAADQRLDWTYVHADGLDRRRARGRSELGGEANAIETRCLCTPVPILLGLRAPFGAGTQRLPRVWGYHPTIGFDEGDLYGTLGLAPHGPGAMMFVPGVRLVTFGVWIQTEALRLLPEVRVGGVVSFDRLRKTADHAAVVHDEVHEEMRARLRPYAQRLVTGEPAPGLLGVRRRAGAGFAQGELRPWLRAQRRVVVLQAEQEQDGEISRATEAVGQALDAPVLVCPGPQVDDLRRLAGPGVSLLEPERGTAEAMAFYRQAEAPPPPPPWLSAPLALAPLAADELPPELAELMPIESAVQASLFAPVEPGPAAGGVWAQVLTLGRLAWQGRLSGEVQGQWLQIRMPDCPPARLWRPAGRDGKPVAEALAERVLFGAGQAQARLLARCVAGLGLGQTDCSLPGPRRLLLRAVLSDGLLRYRAGLAPGLGPRLALTCLERDPGLLELPVLRCLSGRRLGLRELLEDLPATGGLVYGALEGAPADLADLDTDRILALDEESEALLVALLGSGAYCRVDRREVLAASHGLCCRDLALGLRSFPDFPLLVEGGEPAALSPGERSACLAHLAAQLCRRLDPGVLTRLAEPALEEEARQALRHLQWLALGSLERGDLASLERLRLADLALFPTVQGEALSPRELGVALMDGAELSLEPARDLGPREFESLARPRRARRRPPGGRLELAAPPFLGQRLARLASPRLDFDFDLSDAEAERDPAPPLRAYLESVEVIGPELSGRVGLPADEGVRGRILLRASPRGPGAGLDARMGRDGPIGIVLHRGGLAGESLRAGAEEALEQALARLAQRLCLRIGGQGEAVPRADVPRVERALLAYADARLRLIRAPTGGLQAELGGPSVARVLALPLFPLGDGNRVSGRRLLDELCVLGPERVAEPVRGRAWALARSSAPSHLSSWLDGLRAPGRAPAAGRAPTPGLATTLEPGPDALSKALEFWLGALSPPRPVRVVLADPARPARLADPTSFAPGELGAAACEHDFWGEPERLVVRLNARHPLVREARERSGLDEPLAWLLAAAAGLLQSRLRLISPEDELGFHRRVLGALAAGERLWPD